MQHYYLFAGPSAFNLNLAKYPWLTNLGPAKQSDILDLIKFSKVQNIIIADGLYKSIPAPWHKELLIAIDRGISVIGTSSIGALRAAEMSDYGLVGFGKVYYYLQSSIVDDSEVAVVHCGEDDSWQPLTIAHVEVIFWIKKLLSCKLIDNCCATSILNYSKSIFFERRSFALILNELSRLVPNADSDKLASLWFSQKQLDLLQLLDQIDPNITSPAVHSETNKLYLNSINTSFTPYIARQETRDSRPFHNKTINSDLAHISSCFLAFILLTHPVTAQDSYIISYTLILLSASLRRLRMAFANDYLLIEKIDTLLLELSEYFSSHLYCTSNDFCIDINIDRILETLDDITFSRDIQSGSSIDQNLLLSCWNPDSYFIGTKVDSDTSSYVQLKHFLHASSIYFVSHLLMKSKLEILSHAHRDTMNRIICDSIISGREVHLPTLSLAFKIREEIECYTLFHHHSRKIVLNRLLSSPDHQLLRDSWENFLAIKPAEYPHSFYLESSERKGIIHAQHLINQTFSSWIFLTQTSLDALSFYYLDNWQLIYIKYVLMRRGIEN